MTVFCPSVGARASTSRLTFKLATIACLLACTCFAGRGTWVFAGTFRAGCHVVDVSPRVLPAIRNGGFLEQTNDRVDDPLAARCLALSDGDETLCIAIVDSCMIPRDVCDAIKARAEQLCGIPADRILIAATHTHSAPSLMDYCLGSRKDPAYAETFIPTVASGIAQAHAKLEPAEAGWSSIDAPDHTHCRRWLYQPNAYADDPFGERTVRAMMHPGYENPQFLGPAGPVDSKLTVLSIRSTDGRPLALLCNYSMHYFGAGAGFSADYFGDFARNVEAKVERNNADVARFVAIMSQGTSGDLHWMDYARPKRERFSREQYAGELGELALKALESIEHRRDVDLAMQETRLTLSRRLPSNDRLRWAAASNEARGTRRPKDRPEVYAEQAAWIHEHPTTELVLQCVRIGDLGLTAIPNEVYAITGLKLKAQSPLQPLMNLELANGAEGYIPPPEQHYLGGYTTWPARTAGLEVEAEPKIVEALLKMLEELAGGAGRRALPDDLYNEQQRQAIEQARRDDNNRENRGAAVATESAHQ